MMCRQATRLRILRAALVLRALSAAAVLLTPTPSHAGPPYATDDPEPVGYGHWEVYLATQHAINRDRATGSVPLIDLNYGAWPGLHLHAMGQLSYARPSDGPTSYGAGDTELGEKIRFVNEGEWCPMMSVYPLFDLPTGDSSRQLGTGHWYAFLPVWLQKSAGPWTTFGGGGLWFNPGAGNRDYWYFGWEVQRRIASLALGTELFYTTPNKVGGDANLRFNIGTIYDLTEHHHLLISAGRSIVGSSLFQSYVAYQLTL
jgi:hypothetical protein